MNLSTETLERENSKIRDLCAVLKVLLDNPALRSNTVACELLDRFNCQVKAHLLHENQTVFSKLLTGHGAQGEKVASQFLSNTHQLKKIFADYENHWCHDLAGSASLDAFVVETRDLIQLVMSRIDLENNKLLPLLAE